MVGFSQLDLRHVLNDDNAAEITGIAAADIVHDFLSMFLTQEPPKTPTGATLLRDEL